MRWEGEEGNRTHLTPDPANCGSILASLDSGNIL